MSEYCFVKNKIVLSGGYRIMIITPAFQAGDAGLIPATRSNVKNTARPPK